MKSLILRIRNSVQERPFTRGDLTKLSAQSDQRRTQPQQADPGITPGADQGWTTVEFLSPWAR